MLGLDMRGHQLDCDAEHRGIIGIADDRQRIGDQIVRRDEINNGADEHGLDVYWGVAIEGAIMRGQDVLEERNGRYFALELAPQLAAQAGFVVRHPAGERGKIRPKIRPSRGLLPKPHKLRASCSSPMTCSSPM